MDDVLWSLTFPRWWFRLDPMVKILWLRCQGKAPSVSMGVSRLWGCWLLVSVWDGLKKDTTCSTIWRDCIHSQYSCAQMKTFQHYKSWCRMLRMQAAQSWRLPVHGLFGSGRCQELHGQVGDVWGQPEFVWTLFSQDFRTLWLHVIRFTFKSILNLRLKQIVLEIWLGQKDHQILKKKVFVLSTIRVPVGVPQPLACQACKRQGNDSNYRALWQSITGAEGLNRSLQIQAGPEKALCAWLGKSESEANTWWVRQASEGDRFRSNHWNFWAPFAVRVPYQGYWFAWDMVLARPNGCCSSSQISSWHARGPGGGPLYSFHW